MYTNECNLTYLRSLTDSLNNRDEKLKERDKLVQLVFDNCPAGLVIWGVDKNLIFTLSEGRGLKNLGLKEGQSIGKSLYEYFDTISNILNINEFFQYFKIIKYYEVKSDK